MRKIARGLENINPGLSDFFASYLVRKRVFVKHNHFASCKSNAVTALRVKRPTQDMVYR